MKHSYCIATLALMLCSVLSNAALLPSQEGYGASPVSAIFAFGDSIIDSGNNNFLRSIAKSNYWPYGIDFSSGPTGRFCNGKTVLDLLGEKVSVPYLPAFADPSATGLRILRGVNYASAGAGILDETGRHWGDRFSLSQQVLNFERTLDQLRISFSGRNLTQFLEKSVAFLAFGSNDYINNYLMPSFYDSSLRYRPEEFASILLNHYGRQILALYSVGLRKFFIVGLAPLGCIPNQRATGQVRCADAVNQLLGSFNEGLRALVAQFNTNHAPAANFVYFNAYAALGDVLNNPVTYGLSVIDRPCCGIGQITCVLSSVPCLNRNQYLFWDAYHTTEAANTILAQRIFIGPASDCYPMNFQQLAFI